MALNNNYDSYIANGKESWFEKPKTVDPKTALAPLIRHIKTVDTLRLKFQKEGGKLSDLDRFFKLLSAQITIPGRNNQNNVSLTDRRSLQWALDDISWELHIQVRQLPNGFPVFYISRTKYDYFLEYELVVEELYRSPDYEIYDERFVKLMAFNGHEVNYLRLAQFNTKTEEMIKERNLNVETDELLYTVGKNVFENCWHEDQQIAFLCAEYFPHLNRFRCAIELLYLCLASELCELRRSVDRNMLLFFQHIYPQDSIRRFLRHIVNLRGSELSDIPIKARPLFVRLSESFNEFLSTEVIYGNRKVKVPLYKVIFGNITRMKTISERLAGNKAIISGAKKLDGQSYIIIKEVI